MGKITKKRFLYLILFILALFLLNWFLNPVKIDVDCPDTIVNKTQIIKEWVVQIDDKSYNYELLRLKSDKRPSYAMHIKNRRPETVLITKPYEPISWSCEDADKYNWFDINKIATDSNMYLYNWFSVLNVFWRFYDSWDIENDIQDMLAGLKFLEWKKVWITWWSWWWFEAVYAAARSKNKPVIWTAFFPPTDIENMYNWSKTTGEDFFVAYQDRIDAWAKWDYSKWNHDFLVNNLKTNFLIYHAYEDTLVPIEQTIKLTKLTDSVSSIINNKKKAKLSHWENIWDSLLPIELSVLPIFLMRWLVDDDLIIVADKKELEKVTDKEIIKILDDKKLIIFEVNENKMMWYDEFKKFLNK